jgi:hypothetical protein
LGDDDERNGRNASSSSLGGRAGCVALITNAFVNRGGLDLLSSNLGRLDESFKDEGMCSEDERRYLISAQISGHARRYLVTPRRHIT